LKSTNSKRNEEDNDKSRLKRIKGSSKEAEMTPMKLNELKIVFDNKNDVNNNYQNYSDNRMNSALYTAKTPDRSFMTNNTNKLSKKTVFVNA